MKLKRAYLRLLVDDRTFERMQQAQRPVHPQALDSYAWWCAKCDTPYIVCPCLFNLQHPMHRFTIED